MAYAPNLAPLLTQYEEVQNRLRHIDTQRPEANFASAGSRAKEAHARLATLLQAREQAEKHNKVRYYPPTHTYTSSAGRRALTLVQMPLMGVPLPTCIACSRCGG